MLIAIHIIAWHGALDKRTWKVEQTFCLACNWTANFRLHTINFQAENRVQMGAQAMSCNNLLAAALLPLLLLLLQVLQLLLLMLQGQRFRCGSFRSHHLSSLLMGKSKRLLVHKQPFSRITFNFVKQ